MQAEGTISKLTKTISKNRDMSKYYDVYEAFDKLEKLREVPQGMVQEQLIINAEALDLKEDLRAAILQIWKSQVTTGCAFICCPYVMSIFW